MPAVRNPTAKLEKSIDSIELIFITSKNAAPIIAGIAIKKENLDAFCLFIPNNKAIVIVIPDLEIPGKIAIA